MVVKAHGMMQEHIHHVQRDLSAHMEDCLDVRTAEISQQKALEAAGQVSAVQQEAIVYVHQQGAQVIQAAEAKVSAHMVHVEQTAQKIIMDKTIAVVQEAQVHCAKVQSDASAAISQAQQVAHAATSSKDLAVQEGVSKTMQTADKIYEIMKAAIILETHRAAHAQCEAEQKKLR